MQLILSQGGSCFLPQRMAEPLVASGQLGRVADSPSFALPAYAVFPTRAESSCEQAMEKLRQLLKAFRPDYH
ncbi:MAG: hypothetical protein R3E89_11100 [Thiolinea sp.]